MNKTKTLSLLICIILCLVILAFFSPMPLVYAGEEITNGGFETGDFTGWTNSGCSVTSGEYHTGSYSAKMTYSMSFKQDGLSIAYSSITSAKAWVKKGSGASAYTYFNFVTDDSSDNYLLPYDSGGYDWTEFDLLAIMDAAGAYGTLTEIGFIRMSDNFCDYWVDDVSVITGVAASYECRVVSSPEIAATWKLDAANYYTPWTSNITEGVRHLEATELTATRDSGQNMYGFTHWMVTNSSGSFNITAADIYPDIQSEHNFTLFYDDSYTVRVDSTPYSSATFTATGYAFTAPKILIRYADNHTFVCTLFEVEVNASYKYTFDHWSINGSGYYGSLSIEVEIEGDTNLTIHYIGSWIPTPYIPTFAHEAINGTWYFRSDTHTIHEILGYRLDFVNTNTYTYTTRTQSHFTLNISYGIRVWIIDIFGNTYELSGGTPEAIVTRTIDGEGYQSAYFDCPAYAGLIDAVQVNVYQKMGGEWWVLRRYFITDENLYIKLPASSWTIRYYTNRTTASTTAYFFHGSTTFNSKIMFQYYNANPWELALARLQAQNYLGFMTTPWTYYLGDIFWSLALLFGIVTMYNRQGSLKPILALLWLFGGAGSVLSLMVPALVLHIAWLMLAVAMGLTLFKLIYR